MNGSFDTNTRNATSLKPEFNLPIKVYFARLNIIE